MCSRSPQVVPAKQRKTAVLWMVEEAERCGSEKELSSKAVQNFPSIFRTNNVRTKRCCLQKAYRWYRSRLDFLDALQIKENKALTITCTAIPGVSVKRCNVRALSGRGRKRADWVEYLHAGLLEEFERNNSAGV